MTQEHLIILHKIYLVGRLAFLMAVLPPSLNLRNTIKFSRFISFDKGHLPKHLLTLDVTYLFAYGNTFPSTQTL